MLFRAPTVLAVALFASFVLARDCRPGEYKNAQGNCRTCPEGSVNPNSSPENGPQTSCTPCPAGQSSNPTRTECQKCEPGFYNNVSGGTCRECADGYFNNVSGAKSCCQCCAGFYSNTQHTNCLQCPTARRYSFPGSDEMSDCSSTKGTRPNPVTSCDMVATNVCPNPTGPGPVGTAITRKKRMHCTRGLESCPHYSGRGGFECVDTQSDPESCGGCVSLDGKGSGTDCTAIAGVSIARCAKGSCIIDACRKGYTKSLDGSSCTLVGSKDGSNFNSQSVGATRKRSSPAKRAIRGRVY